MKKVLVSIMMAALPMVAVAQISTYSSPYEQFQGLVTPDETWERPADGIRTAETFKIVLQTPLSYSFERKVPKPKQGEPVPPMPLVDPTRPAFEHQSYKFGDAAGVVNASAEKPFLAVELFGCGQRVPMDLVEDLRAAAVDEAVARGRHYVADAQAVLGTIYTGEPVYYGGDPGPFTLTTRLKMLYARGVRYVLSAVVDEYGTHAYTTSDDPKASVRYESAFSFHITGYDLDNREILQSRLLVVRGDGRNYDEADARALSSAASEIRYYITSNFRRTANIVSLGEANARDKVKECEIAVGFADGAAKGDTYQACTVGSNGRTNNLGRVRITDVLGDDLSECKITTGKDKLVSAFKQGLEIVLITD